MKELFYGIEGQERLNSDPDDTIQELLASMLEDETLEYPVKVLVYEKEKMWEEENIEKFSKSILEDILEQLDDKYGDPDDYGSYPTERMSKASLDLAKVIIEDYYVWACVPNGEIIEYTEEQIKELGY